jgi:hypothetical protein
MLEMRWCRFGARGFVSAEKIARSRSRMALPGKAIARV